MIVPRSQPQRRPREKQAIWEQGYGAYKMTLSDGLKKLNIVTEALAEFGNKFIITI